MQRTINAITAILGKENVFAEPAACVANARTAAYGQGKLIPPFACARPRHLREMAALLKFCSGEGIPVVFRGGGTSALMSASPRVPDSLLILTSGLDHIKELDAENMQAVVQPGVTCAKLAHAASQKGLFLPPEPWSAAIATIGGNIAVNAAGSGYLKYGPTANYINAVNLLCTDGTTIACPGANGLVSGLPLPTAGSGGCLGFIAESRLRLLPVPRYRSWETAQFPDFDALCAACALLAPLGAASLELFDKLTASALLGKDASQPLLAVQIHADTPDLAAEARSIIAKCQGAIIPFPDFTDARPGVLPALMATKGSFTLLQIACPPGRLPVLLEKVQDLAKETPCAIMGYAGVARLYVAVLGDARLAQPIAQELFTLELLLNDALQSEADAALSRSEWRGKYSQTGKLENQLRKVFDPAGILAARPLPGVS